MAETTIPGETTPSERSAGEAVLERGVRLNRARRRLFLHALVVGLTTGLVAVVFRICLERGEEFRHAMIEGVGELPEWTRPFCYVLPPFMLIGFASYLVLRFCPEASGSGIPHLRMVLRENASIAWRRILPVKFLSGLSAIVGGLCLGREGPTIQMGAALGAMWGRSRAGKSADRRSLLVSGAGAGLAAAFNAPFAGILFVMEELHINIPDSAFFTAMISCVSADLVSRMLLGQDPVLHATLRETPPLESLPFFLVLGVCCGVASWFYNHALIGATRRLNVTSFRANAVKVVVAAVIAGYLAWRYPILLGGGLALSNEALAGQGALRWLALMLALRFVLSIGSYAIGTAGGIFAPLLVLGGLLGLIVGDLAQRLFPAAVPEPNAFAMVGMAAAFAGVVRCPLTGVMLIVEMTGIYELILPLMVAAFAASITADELLVPPIYDGLLGTKLAAAADDAPQSGD